MTEKDKNKCADDWLSDFLYAENMNIKDIPKDMKNIFRKMYKMGYSDGIDEVEKKINDLLNKLW